MAGDSIVKCYLMNLKMNMQAKIFPVFDPKDDKIIQLYDMYLEGEWLGSRRTVVACKTYLTFIHPDDTVEIEISSESIQKT